jgi:hypothetical protein
LAEAYFMQLRAVFGLTFTVESGFVDDAVNPPIVLMVAASNCVLQQLQPLAPVPVKMDGTLA